MKPITSVPPTKTLLRTELKREVLSSGGWDGAGADGVIEEDPKLQNRKRVEK